jgi:hypothetical protein
MGSVETNFPSEMSIVMVDQPIRFYRSSSPPSVEEMMAPNPNGAPQLDLGFSGFRWCQSVHWSRVRPRN